MKVAQVAPLMESVPPRGYGGTERIVSYLTEELVQQGHDVTLYASADSITTARLRPQAPRALRLTSTCLDPIPEHLLMVDRVFQDIDEFDIVHFHIDYLHFILARGSVVPHVTTMHGRLDLPDISRLFRAFRNFPFISISDAQREPMPWVNWCRTVYHGIPHDLHAFVPIAEPYLVFLGRISPEKRVDRAIEIAKAVGLRLRIGAKLDKSDREYFETRIRPMLGHPLVEFIGEIGDAEKSELLGNAMALLFPIDWPEPFGLVMIEALACGTPVIAFSCGSVPEVITDGVTGFVVGSVEEAVQAVHRVESLSRARCREVFEEKFTARRMAGDHLAVYAQLMEDAHGNQGHLERPRGRPVLGSSAFGLAG